MGLEIQDDWTFPLSTGAKCLEKGGLGENCNSLNSLRHPSPGCTVHWLLIRELYSYNRHHCPDVDALQCFPSRKQRLLGSGKSPDLLLWWGALTLHPLESSSCGGEHSPPVSLQLPSPPQASKRKQSVQRPWCFSCWYGRQIIRFKTQSFPDPI